MTRCLRRTMDPHVPQRCQRQEGGVTMATQRPFRFGTGCYRATSRQEYLTQVRRIADQGYAVLVSPDHFEPQLTPLIALMAAADASPTLRIASYVCANDFRHPALLAKEVATLDVLSDGRFELGLGAGYMGADYTLSGIPLDPPGVRIARLEEAIQIMKGLFAGGPVTFAGAYYTVRGLEGFPHSVQRPHPPLFLAGGGKRMLSLAAREADIVGIIMQARGGQLDLMDGSIAATMRRVEWVRQAAGARFDALELNTLVLAVEVTEQRERAAEHLAATCGTTAEQVLESIHFLVGTVEQMVEAVQMWRERFGISYICVIEEYRDALAPVVARLAGT